MLDTLRAFAVGRLDESELSMLRRRQFGLIIGVAGRGERSLKVLQGRDRVAR